ncbi:MAG: ABC transporter substrate-binding protein [Planctomycetes bacterium]|nr:ABC transporter substrate-binding protein [Planctomycetota bacterium]
MRTILLQCAVIATMALVPLSAAEPVRIGGVYPLTGDVAAIGQNIRRGIEFAVEEINSLGGVNGQPIEMVWGDTQGDPKVGMSEAERLITREKVVCLIGAYQSAVTEVVSQTAERYQTPFLTAISTANVLTTRGYKYFFRLAPTNMSFLQSMLQFVHDYNQAHQGGRMKTIAVVADNTLLGQETLEWAKYWANELGYEIIQDVLYSKGTADLTSEVLALKSANPDILVADSYISDCLLLTKTMAEQNFKPAILIGKATGFIDPTYIPNVGSMANGITTAIEWGPDLTKGRETNERFREQFGIDMNGHSAQSYTAMWVLKTAMEDAGTTTDKAKIRDALAALKVERAFPNGPEIILPYNVIHFEDVAINGVQHTNLNTNALTTVAQIQDGKYVTVWPFDSTDNEVLFPAPYE